MTFSLPSTSCLLKLPIRELKQQRRQRQRKRQLKINIWEIVTILLLFLPRIPYFSSDRARGKWTGRSAVEGNIENERFAVVCSRCRQNLKFGNFTLSFGTLRPSTCSTIIIYANNTRFTLRQMKLFFPLPDSVPVHR